MTDDQDTTMRREAAVARHEAEETAHVVAALAMRLGGIDERMLPTLMFLADLRCMRTHGRSVLRGPWASTTAGPIHVRTRDLLVADSRPSTWGRFIRMEGPVGARTIRIVTNRTQDDLDMMSVATTRIIEDLANRVRHLDVDAIHAWMAQDPMAAAFPATPDERPIPMVEMLVAAGMDRTTAIECDAEETSLRAALDMFL